MICVCRSCWTKVFASGQRTPDSCMRAGLSARASHVILPASSQIGGFSPVFRFPVCLFFSRLVFLCMHDAPDSRMTITFKI